MKNQIQYCFGDKLREVRERRGLTLKSVAGKAHVSESLVSQIERNRVSPSIDTLLHLAEILEIDPDYLFRDLRKSKRVDLVRKEEGRSISTPQVTYRQLSGMPDRSEEYSVEAFLMDIEEGCEKGSQEYGHRGREFGYILKGKGKLSYGADSYDLREGDSIAFASDTPHVLVNTGKGPLRALWVITPARNIFGE